MAPQYKRKRLWINPAFQARLLARLVVYLMVFVVIVWQTCVVLEILPGLVDSNNLSSGIGGLYLQCLARQKPLLLALLLTLPAALYDLLKFSHRLAGPLYRCQRVMEEMAAGRAVPEFAPREGDHMPEFFQAFNAVIKQWNARAGGNGQAEDSDHAAVMAPEPRSALKSHKAPEPRKAGA
jgi:hypothetical protein